MVAVSISLDTREVRDAIQALRHEGPRAIAELLNKVTLDARLAVQDEIRGVFLFAGGPGGSTEKFLTNSVLFVGATPDKLRTDLYLRRGGRVILERHVEGASIAATDPRVGPDFEGKIAVPNLRVVKRGKSGRIVAADTPQALLQRRARGRTRGYLDRARGKIIKREKGGAGRLAYALVDRVRLKPTFDFFGVAHREVIKQLPRKAARVLEKINLRRSR